jgi:hypothetical protein
MKILFFTKNIIMILMLSVLYVSINPTDIFAAQITSVNVPQQNDFVLEPGKVEVFLNPGESVTRTISVTNRIGRKVKFAVVVEDFVGTTDPDRPVLLLGDDDSPNSFRRNIKPDTQEFTLDFGQRISIPITIDVPLNAQPGGFYSSVIISNQPDKDNESASTTEALARNKIISRLGVLFFVRVNGEANESGQVTDFRIGGPKKIIREEGPLSFEILFENTGSVHLVPYGTIDIKNTLRQRVAKLPVDAYFSLPKSLRYRTIDWDKKFLLGRYTADLSLNKGYGNLIDERRIAFWVIPWKFVAIAFAIIFMISSVLYYIVTRFEFKRKE